MFDIKCITLYEKCQYRKNLNAGSYLFGNTDLKDFFGKDVTLHTIVGRNGSGKSSLLDIMFRLVNNVGAVMCKQESREASAKVRFVRHIYADFEYEKSFPGVQVELDANGEAIIHHCKLCCRDTSLWLEYDSRVYWLADVELRGLSEENNNYYDNLKAEYGSRFLDYSDMRSSGTKQTLSLLLFYTVATNYSMLGFQSLDYEEEESLEWDDQILLADRDGALLVDSDGAFLTTNGWTEKKNWIKGVFHKNDGYMCPIVLNPFRDGGKINMDTEAALTVNRLSALLISERMDVKPLIEDYYLDKICYNRKTDFYLRFKPVYDKNDKDNPERKNLLAEGGDLDLFKKTSTRRFTTSWTVLDELGYPVKEGLSDTECYLRLYLVYKVLNIAATYPFYEDYRRLGDINRVFGITQRKRGFRDLLRQLVKKVRLRETHIEQKFHQALSFIEKIEAEKKDNPFFDTNWMERGFTFDDYRRYLNVPEYFQSVEECLGYLPPNLFWQTIYLKRKDEKTGEWERDIPFKRMSSGQKQMLYQLSTLMYHLLNLKSVPKNQVHYYQVSIVLDEIEVCFHPEYQRMFISRLLDLLVNKLHLNNEFGIHILMTTHSPFILSDIPNEQISYMENGHQLTKEELAERKIRYPMAGNISELLHQSFFLHDGFIGEYARQKILSLVRYLKDGEAGPDGWDREQAKLFIDGISEPYIHKQLMMLYEN